MARAPIDAGDAVDAAAQARDAGVAAEVPDAAPPEAVAVPTPARRVLDTDGAREWLARHGVTTPDAEHRIAGCSPVAVGAPTRDGLWCIGNAGPMKGSFDTGESLFPLTVWVAEAHRLRAVLELPVAAGALDRLDLDVTGDPNQGNYILLAATLAPDSASITLSEKDHPNAKCAAVLAAHASKDLEKHRRVIQAACNAVGTYVWRGDRFVRVAPAKKPGAGASSL